MNTILEKFNKLCEMIDDVRYPGQRLDENILLYDGKMYYYSNGKTNEIDLIRGVNTVYVSMIHDAVGCQHFNNRNFIQDVSYGSLEDIRKQTEDDYSININMMNFLFSLKVCVNEVLKDKSKSILLGYNYDEDDYFIIDDYNRIMFNFDEWKNQLENE